HLRAATLLSTAERDAFEDGGKLGAAHTFRGIEGITRERVVYSAGSVFYFAGAGRLGGAGLDACDFESGIQYWSGKGWSFRDALLASRGDCRCDSGRMACGPLDAPHRTGTDLCERNWDVTNR